MTITIPITCIENAIKSNQYTLKNLKDDRLITNALDGKKYNGDFFKNLVDKQEIREWVYSYCSLCGKPVIFKFKEDKIYLENRCDCDNVELNKNNLSYDEFAVWYYNLTDKKIKQKFESFWFNKE